MDTSEPGTSNSKSDVMSPTTTASSSPLGNPGNSNANPGISPNDVNIPVPGWAAMATRIANRPAFEAFPAFTDLNVRSLLYYQAELIFLRKKLHEEEYKNHYLGEGAQLRIARNLDFLIASGRGKQKSEQWELIEQIRTVLDKYSKPLW
jgi:hypothetical protein